jgi:peroxidase
MSDVINKPKILEADDNYDSLARGMVTQSFQKADKNFDIEVKELLFKRFGKFGKDIRAIDIQRSRDHGIAGYNSFRELCGLGRAEKWDDFLDLIPSEVFHKIIFS